MKNPFSGVMSAFADLFKQGVAENEEDILRRSIRNAGHIHQLLGQEGWNVLRIRLAEEIEAELRMLLSDTKTGRVGAEAIQTRMLPVLGIVQTLEVVNRLLEEGQKDVLALQKLQQRKMTGEQNLTNQARAKVRIG